MHLINAEQAVVLHAFEGPCFTHVLCSLYSRASKSCNKARLRHDKVLSKSQRGHAQNLLALVSGIASLQNLGSRRGENAQM